MKMRMILAAILICLSLNLAQAEVLKNISIVTRSGVSVSALLITPSSPNAALILMPGGPGVIDLSGTTIGRTLGFLSANFENFAAKNLTVVIVDAPSDQAGGLLPRFRQTAAHLKDLKAVIARIKHETNLPVWLIGISRGAISVLHAAVNSNESINGFIALSSPTRIPPRSGVIRLTDLELDRVKIPALLGGHRDDGCRGTPPDGAEQIARGLINSPNAAAKIFSGGRDIGRNPCGPGSPHTFEGIHDEVVEYIANFIHKFTR